MSPDEAPIEPEVGKDTDEYLEVLTSTGRIRPSLARSLREQGLDLDGIEKCDREAFLGYKGVGDKTADALMEIGALVKERRSREAETAFWEMLAAKKVRINVIKALQGSGLDSIDKVLDAGMDGLMGIKGIGEASAKAVLAAVRETSPPIEEAAAEQAPDGMTGEEEGQVKPPSFMDRITGFFRNLFKSKGSEASTEAEKDAEPTPAGSPSEPIEKEAGPEGSMEPPSVPAAEPGTEPEVPSEPPVVVEESVSIPEDRVEASPEEMPSEEAEVPPQEGQVSEVPALPGTDVPEGEGQGLAEGKVEEGQPTGGLFSRIMAFFKKPKETPPAGAPASDLPAAGTEGAEEVGPDQPSVQTAEEEVEPEKTDIGAGPGEILPDVSAEPPVEIKEIEDVPGIDEAVAKKLRDAGYQDLSELREAVPEDLVLIEGIDKELAERICSALKV